MCLVALIGLLLLNQSPASAQCALPFITLNVSSVAPGGTVTLSGQHFTDGCHDLVIPFPFHVARTRPVKKVRLFLVQGSHSEQIGTVDADKKFKISAKLTIPANSPLGDATIVAEVPGYGKIQPVAFRVTPKESEPPRDSDPKQSP